jgi:hypothetical protein
MDRHRLVLLGLALALAALVAVVVVVFPEGDTAEIPAPLEGVFPTPGDTVVRQTAIEVDLPVGYSMALQVDGRPIPGIEIGLTESTGVWVWQPGPGKSLEQWGAGEHTVVVTWDRVAGGRPDPGEFAWSFRVA